MLVAPIDEEVVPVSPARQIERDEVLAWATGPRGGSVHSYTGAMEDAGHMFESRYIRDTESVREVLAQWENPQDAVADARRPNRTLWVRVPYSGKPGEREGDRWYRLTLMEGRAMAERLARKLNEDAPDGEWTYDSLEDVDVAARYDNRLREIDKRHDRPKRLILLNAPKLGIVEWNQRDERWDGYALSIEVFVAGEIKTRKDRKFSYAISFLNYIDDKLSKSYIDRIVDKLPEYQVTEEQKEKAIDGWLEGMPLEGEPEPEIEVYLAYQDEVLTWTNYRDEGYGVAKVSAG